MTGRLIMFYSAVASSNRVVAAVGKAWADTHLPFRWHQDEANPVFGPAGRGWDSTTIRLDAVLYDDRTLYHVATPALYRIDVTPTQPVMLAGYP